MEEDDDKGRSEATFRYTVQNFSKLKNPALSPIFYVRNLAWKIMVKPEQSENRKGRRTTRNLGFFLWCRNERNCGYWSCNAHLELRLLSVRPDVKTFSKSFQQLFESKNDSNNNWRGWGIADFMNWNNVLDLKKGFIKDDAIALEVHVVADIPHILSPETFLIEAIQRNSLDDIKSLSVNRAIINTIDDEGNMPLHYAIMSGNIEIVDYLIKSKANVCKPGKNGEKPLITAVKTRNIDIIKLLLRHGNTSNTLQSAFLAAVTSQNLEIVKLLIEHGALLDVIYRDGHTALTKSIEVNNSDIVKVLIVHGAKVNMRKSDGTFPLLLAVQTGNSQICNYLINHNGKLGSDSDQAFEYLPKYIEDDNFEMVQILIELGAKLDVIYECGDTALTTAAKMENLEMVEYLIRKGSNVNQSNSDGKVPLAIAASNQDILIVKLLIQSKASLDLAKEELEEFANFDEDFLIYLNGACFVNDTKRNSFEDCGQEAAP